MTQRLTRSFQKILKGVKDIPQGETFPEQFALARFAKKFEIPNSDAADGRRVAAYQQWLSFDENLSVPPLLPGNWYKARLVIHQVINSFRFGDLAITGGSASEPLSGLQSVARKLVTHTWEVSPNCVELFVSLAVRDRAFVRASKMRLREKYGLEYRQRVNRIYQLAVEAGWDDPSHIVRCWIILSCLRAREASRFSTVPKNNLVDRPIDIQPFCNVTTQRAIGLGIKEVLKKHFNLSLDHTQMRHREMIKSCKYATIDLKNASDSVSWRLVEFLFPSWFVKHLRAACPEYTEGLDGHYVVTKKVSSMGNGFTFELMTLILLALLRVQSSDTSVYGDDIVVPKEHAQQVMDDLQAVGFVVNKEKSFVDGPFRESCGANYHADHGYIESYDFFYPKTYSECASFYNKLVRLRRYTFFENLRKQLERCIPMDLQGPYPGHAGPGVADSGLLGDSQESGVEDSFFWALRPRLVERVPDSLMPAVDAYQWEPSMCRMHYGYQYVSNTDITGRKELRPSRDGILILAYLHAGRRIDIPVTGRGQWHRVAYISNGYNSYRAKTIARHAELIS